MEYDNYFYDKLKEISDRINQIETVQKTDIIQIKASIGSLARYIADSQEKVNLSGIESNLDSLSYKIENCNNVVAKDLTSDINLLKNAVRDLGNMQRESLKASQFEDFKTQHINLTVKNNESLLAYIKNIKNSFENIASLMSGLQNRQKEVLTEEEFEKSQRRTEENTIRANEAVLKELDYIKSAAENIKDYQKYMVTENDFSSIKNDLDEVKNAISEIKNKNAYAVNSQDLHELQEEIAGVTSALDYVKSKQDASFTSQEATLFAQELAAVKAEISNIGNLRDFAFTKDEYELIRNEFSTVKNAINDIQISNNSHLTRNDFDNVIGEISEIKSALSDIQNRSIIVDSSENNNAASEELSAIRTAINDIKEKQTTLFPQNIFDGLKDNIDSLGYKLSELKDNFNFMEDKLADLKTSIEYIKDDKSAQITPGDLFELKNNFDFLEDKLSDLKTSIDDIKDDKTEQPVQVDFSELKNNFDLLEDKLSGLKTSIDNIKDDKTEQPVQVDFSELKNNFDLLEDKLSDLKTSIDNIKDDKTEQPVQVDFSELKNNFDFLEDKLSDLKTSIDDIKTDKTEQPVQVDFSELKNDFGSVKEKISAILTELNSVKDATYSINANKENIAPEMANRFNELNFNLKKYIEELTARINSSPSISEIGAVVSDINTLHRDEARQTAEKLQELKNSLSAFESDFRNNDFGTKLSKINEIYSGINKIGEWTEKVGYINQSLENVYARFGENADFDDISDKIDIIYENMSLVNSRMMQLDKISGVTSDITEKLPEIISIKETSTQALESVLAVKNRIGEIFASEPDMEDLVNKIDIIYENLFLLNDKTTKVDEINSIVCDIKNKTAAFEAYKNETSNLLTNVEDIKDKINSIFANPEDWEEIINKIDILYDNLTALNKREEKTDKIASAITEIQDDLSKLDGENLIKKLNEIVTAANGLAKSNDTQNIKETLAFIAKKLENNSTTEDAENILDKIGEVSNKSDLITSEMLDGGFIDKINSLSDKVNFINDTVNDELIFSKIDLIYENISLLNTWVNKLDDLSEKNDIINRHLNTKIEEIGSQIEKISSSIPDLKGNLDSISGELNTISNKTQYATESTDSEIKALKESFGEITQDISSISVRTNKLILSADDANKEFEKCIVTFKNALNDLEIQNKTLNPSEKFDALQIKLAGIYEMMKKNVNASQNLNSAFTYLGNWADEAGIMLTSSSNDISEIKNLQLNQTSKIEEEVKKLSSDLGAFESEFSSAMKTVEGCLKTVSGISDAVKITLKQNQLCLNEIAGIKDTVTKLTETVNNVVLSAANNQTNDIKDVLEKTQNKLSMLEDGFSAFRNDDVSEIKSLMTGVTVQLGTSLRPDIDTLNNKIEQISESEENKFSGFESLVQEKTAKQEKQILSLEERLDALTSKIDKLTESVSENTQDTGIKDVLNYIATQLTNTNENNALIKDVAEKLSSFDSGINKIVSYIEE